ncbi:MAG: hypothetical protein WB630_02130 [Candidatus Acidiferrales bacterium]
MKWKEWDYFNRQWKFEPKVYELRHQRAAATLTRAESNAGIRLVKQDLLKRMLQEGRITEEDLINPGPPKPQKTQKPFIGKRVRIGATLPAHGRARKLAKTLWKYTFGGSWGFTGSGQEVICDVVSRRLAYT